MKSLVNKKNFILNVCLHLLFISLVYSQKIENQVNYSFANQPEWVYNSNKSNELYFFYDYRGGEIQIRLSKKTSLCETSQELNKRMLQIIQNLNSTGEFVEQRKQSIPVNFLNRSGCPCLTIKSRATGDRRFVLLPTVENNLYEIEIRESNPDLSPNETSISFLSSVKISSVPVSSPTTVYRSQKSSNFKQATELPGPTDNVITTADPDRFKPKITIPTPVWGPYFPTCSTDPVAEVPQFSKMFVSKEKGLIDNVINSCLGAVGDAVDALTDLLMNLETLNSKINSINNDVKKQKEIDPKVKQKEQSELNRKILESTIEAYKKTSELYDKMQELMTGPQLFAVKCIWDGAKDYALSSNEDMQKIKKGADDFDKAKESLNKKKEELKRLATSDEKEIVIKIKQTNIAANWVDIISGVHSTFSALNVLYSYFSNPVKMLPYEYQMDYALNNIDGMMSTLLTDCKIRDCDILLQDGISAGQQALTAARKHYAQLNREQMEFRDQNKTGLEVHNFRDFPREIEKAKVVSDEIERKLRQLGNYCSKLEPIAKTLNERVNKYELLYAKGLDLVDNCKLKEAEEVVKELQIIENSDCGHFFPKPYGRVKSDELKGKIELTKQDKNCIDDRYYLKSILVTEAKEYFRITDKQFMFVGLDNNLTKPVYTFNFLSKFPDSVLPGDKFKLDFSASCPEVKTNEFFFVNTWWKTEYESPRLFHGDGSILVGKLKNKIINTSDGSISIEVPNEPVKQLILKVNIIFGESGTFQEWIQTIYEKM